MPQEYYSIIMIVAMVAILYFLMIRPEQKRKKQAQQMRDSLKKGDMITTIGGIVGRIVMVNDSTIIIETSEDRVRMELTKWAVSTTGVQASTEPAKKSAKKEEESEETDASTDEAAEIPAAEEAAPAAEDAENKN